MITENNFVNKVRLNSMYGKYGQNYFEWVWHQIINANGDDMATVTKMHIHYRLQPRSGQEAKDADMDIEIVTFSDPKNLSRQKLEVGQALKELKERYNPQYYYLIAENENGGFRTITKKTAF